MRGSGGTAAPAASVSNAQRAIVWIAALFLVKAVVLALFVTPLWDVPDEVGHYALVADMAEGCRCRAAA
jgi:preprotein translocase subunit SecG